MKKATLEDRIRSYLRAFPAKDVERFMLSMKAILVGNAMVPRGAGAAADRRRHLKRASAAATTFKEISLAAIGGDFLRPLIDNFVISIVDTGALDQFKSELQSGNGGEHSPLFEAWVEMMPHLNSFIREVNAEIERKTPRRRGRKHSDPNRTLTRIGAVYAHIFGQLPTSTEGSAFYSIAVEVLRQKNVQRPVQAAVASLRGH